MKLLPWYVLPSNCNRHTTYRLTLHVWLTIMNSFLYENIAQRDSNVHMNRCIKIRFLRLSNQYNNFLLYTQYVYLVKFSIADNFKTVGMDYTMLLMLEIIYVS